MTSLTPSTASDKRQAAAARLVEAHLGNRAAGLIVARMTRERRGVWLVKSDPTSAAHVVTLEPPTCDCGDELHRHPDGHCKHLRAVAMLTHATATAPVPAPGIAWTPRPARTEWQEEV